MDNFGSFGAFIVKPTIMPDFARNLLHYNCLYVFALFISLIRGSIFHARRSFLKGIQIEFSHTKSARISVPDMAMRVINDCPGDPAFCLICTGCQQHFSDSLD